MDAEEFTALGSTLQDAWHLLVDHNEVFEPYPEIIAAGLQALVPIRGQDRLSHSATSGRAFGAIALSAPADGPRLAEALVHEFRHNELYGLLNSLEIMGGLTLYQPVPDEINALYAPWRDAPRPFGGLFHGVAAHLAIAEYFEGYRHIASSQDSRWAEFEYYRWLQNATRGVRALREANQFTELGKRFMDGMQLRCEELLALPVSDEAKQLAQLASADHEISWLLRNLSPSGETITALAAAWRDHRAAWPLEKVPSRLNPGQDVKAHYQRYHLWQARLRDPVLFARLAVQPDSSPHHPIDLQLTDDQFTTALRLAGQQVTTDYSQAAESWARHSLARNALADDPASTLLRRYPHVVHALHHAIACQTNELPEPEQLVRWLAAAQKNPGVG